MLHEYECLRCDHHLSFAGLASGHPKCQGSGTRTGTFSKKDLKGKLEKVGVHVKKRDDTVRKLLLMCLDKEVLDKHKVGHPLNDLVSTMYRYNCQHL